MKLFILVASCICSCGMAVAEDAIARSAAVVAMLDTSGLPHSVKTAVDFEELRQLTFRTGETVTMVSPDGVETVLTENATVSGTVSWRPSSGGLWTVSNSVSGFATFTFRHSLFGNPPDVPQIVDDEELADMVDASAVGDGSAFALLPLSGLLDRLVLPDGYSIILQDDGLYRLKSSVAGLVWNGKPEGAIIDTRSEGPDRTARLNKSRPVSYTGDGWRGSLSAFSELTVVSPSGVSSSQNLSGTGTTTFRPEEEGVWTLTLRMEDGTAYTGHVSVFGQDFVVTFR